MLVKIKRFSLVKCDFLSASCGVSSIDFPRLVLNIKQDTLRKKKVREERKETTYDGIFVQLLTEIRLEFL